jgi:hypothetical protein
MKGVAPDPPYRDISDYVSREIRAEVMSRGYGDMNEEAEAERVALAASIELATPATDSAVLTDEELRDMELIADSLSSLSSTAASPRSSLYIPYQFSNVLCART